MSALKTRQYARNTVRVALSPVKNFAARCPHYERLMSTFHAWNPNFYLGFTRFCHADCSWMHVRRLSDTTLSTLHISQNGKCALAPAHVAHYLATEAGAADKMSRHRSCFLALSSASTSDGTRHLPAEIIRMIANWQFQAYLHTPSFKRACLAMLPVCDHTLWRDSVKKRVSWRDENSKLGHAQDLCEVRLIESHKPHRRITAAPNIVGYVLNRQTGKCN